MKRTQYLYTYRVYKGGTANSKPRPFPGMGFFCFSVPDTLSTAFRLLMVPDTLSTAFALLMVLTLILSIKIKEE